MRIIFGLLLLLFLQSCSGNSNSVLTTQQVVALIDTTGKTVQTRIKVPADFKRIPVDSASFGFYLRNVPLKPHGTKAVLFNGTPKANYTVVQAVLDIDVGTSDLQQCADAVMRLRAEYLYGQKRYTDIHFNFTNGFKAEYSKWAEGYRIKVSGNSVSWVKTAGKDYSYNTFKSYLIKVYTFAGTLSLSRELTTVKLEDMQIGDIFIHGGSPGHAVIVMDVAENLKTKQKAFIIAQSYMPAQSIHILKNFNQSELSPWYELSRMTKLYSPEWTFEKSELKRFS